MCKKIGFIGTGNMAQAIIKGMVRNDAFNSKDINVYDLDTAKLTEFSSELNLNMLDSILDVQAKSDIIVLAVKPQNYEEVLTQLKSEVSVQKVFVSIAAGISINFIREKLNCNCPCVRTMPNTPLLLGQGATAISYSDNIDSFTFEVVKSMFSLSGICEILPENQMNTIISVNGSSPAYFYLFAQAMQDYATQNGIDKDVAMKLICQTLRGSADMLEKSGDTPLELINKVSSKGGTTVEALATFKEKGVYESIKQGMDSCTKRAYELSK